MLFLGGGRSLSAEVVREYARRVADDMRSAARPVYSIGAVSRMLGVETSTLRSWEERYGVVVPARSEGGQRLFSRDQVDQLRAVAELVAGGLQPREAHRLLEDRAIDGAVAEGGGEGLRRVLILLAERDRFAAELGEFLLRTEGFEVVSVLDARQASAISVERAPDLALVELLISGGAGVRLCAELTGRGVRVVAMSVLGLREEALEAGAEAFLVKPFEPLQLVSTVRDLLGVSALTGGGTGRVGM